MWVANRHDMTQIQQLHVLAFSSSLLKDRICSASRLPHNKSFDWSKLNAFSEDKVKVAKVMTFVFDRVENIVEKGENAGCQHFPTVFSKGLSLQVVVS